MNGISNECERNTIASDSNEYLLRSEVTFTFTFKFNQFSGKYQMIKATAVALSSNIQRTNKAEDLNRLNLDILFNEISLSLLNNIDGLHSSCEKYRTYSALPNPKLP